MSDGAASPVANDLVTIVASTRDASLADAALRAALDAGVPWRDFDKRVLIVWDGAEEAGVKARSSGAEVVRMRVPVPAASAADAVRAELARVGGVQWIEPVAISKAQLDAWARPSAGPSITAPVVDEGDRRWLWAVVLLLLALEWWLRRQPVSAIEDRSSQEARVA